MKRLAATWRLFAPTPKQISSILNGTGLQPPAITRVG